MKKLSSERVAIVFVCILIASNTGSYILGKSLATSSVNDTMKMFSMPLLITIMISIVVVFFAVLKKK